MNSFKKLNKFFKIKLRYSKFFLLNKWYKFKCWAWKRYTTVKPRTLDHTYCDKTELIPHLIFECLTQFVEEELVLEEESIGSSDDCWKELEDLWKKKNNEIYTLYNWWTKDYPVLLKKLDDNYNYEEENALNELLTKQAQRVVEIRNFMWT